MRHACPTDPWLAAGQRRGWAPRSMQSPAPTEGPGRGAGGLGDPKLAQCRAELRELADEVAWQERVIGGQTAQLRAYDAAIQALESAATKCAARLSQAGPGGDAASALQPMDNSAGCAPHQLAADLQAAVASAAQSLASAGLRPSAGPDRPRRHSSERGAHTRVVALPADAPAPDSATGGVSLSPSRRRNRSPTAPVFQVRVHRASEGPADRGAGSGDSARRGAAWLDLDRAEASSRASPRAGKSPATPSTRDRRGPHAARAAELQRLQDSLHRLKLQHAVELERLRRQYESSLGTLAVELHSTRSRRDPAAIVAGSEHSCGDSLQQLLARGMATPSHRNREELPRAAWCGQRPSAERLSNALKATTEERDVLRRAVAVLEQALDQALSEQEPPHGKQAPPRTVQSRTPSLGTALPRGAVVSVQALHCLGPGQPWKRTADCSPGAQGMGASPGLNRARLGAARMTGEDRGAPELRGSSRRGLWTAASGACQGVAPTTTPRVAGGGVGLRPVSRQPAGEAQRLSTELRMIPCKVCGATDQAPLSSEPTAAEAAERRFQPPADAAVTRTALLAAEAASAAARADAAAFRATAERLAATVQSLRRELSAARGAPPPPVPPPPSAARGHPGADAAAGPAELRASSLGGAGESERLQPKQAEARQTVSEHGPRLEQELGAARREGAAEAARLEQEPGGARKAAGIGRGGDAHGCDVVGGRAGTGAVGGWAPAGTKLRSSFSVARCIHSASVKPALCAVDIKQAHSERLRHATAAGTMLSAALDAADRAERQLCSGNGMVVQDSEGPTRSGSSDAFATRPPGAGRTAVAGSLPACQVVRCSACEGQAASAAAQVQEARSSAQKRADAAIEACVAEVEAALQERDAAREEAAKAASRLAEVVAARGESSSRGAERDCCAGWRQRCAIATGVAEEEATRADDAEAEVERLQVALADLQPGALRRSGELRQALDTAAAAVRDAEARASAATAAARAAEEAAVAAGEAAAGRAASEVARAGRAAAAAVAEAEQRRQAWDREREGLIAALRHARGQHAAGPHAAQAPPPHRPEERESRGAAHDSVDPAASVGALSRARVAEAKAERLAQQLSSAMAVEAELRRECSGLRAATAQARLALRDRAQVLASSLRSAGPRPGDGGAVPPDSNVARLGKARGEATEGASSRRPVEFTVSHDGSVRLAASLGGPRGVRGRQAGADPRFSASRSPFTLDHLRS
uniref:Uncharacterized protein n=1 Tax=Cafeteria roenbergensis TaxID=33653 RepID=A0A7S0PHG5_CAFRO